MLAIYNSSDGCEITMKAVFPSFVEKVHQIVI